MTSARCPRRCQGADQCAHNGRKPREAAKIVTLARATPTVIVVDSDHYVREALELLIRAQGWQPLTFASAGQFLALPRVASPCCLVLDVNLPDLDGLDLQQQVSDRTDMPVIFIAVQTDVQTAVRAMQAGALEYLMKPLRDDVLLSAIRLALERSRTSVSSAAATQRVRQCYTSLSRRERQVMELVVSGWLNKQIGAALSLSEITVKGHRGRMKRKMKAESLPELVKMAATLGLVTVPRAHGYFLPSLTTYVTARNHSGRILGIPAKRNVVTSQYNIL